MKKGFVLSLLGACIAVSSQAGAAALPAVVTFTDNGKVCDVTQYGAEGHRLQIALNRIHSNVLSMIVRPQAAVRYWCRKVTIWSTHCS